MTVGIKYCGGCNPRWERGSAAARLREAFPDVRIVRAGENPADLVAVVCGCHVACADHSGLEGRCGKLVLTGEADCVRLIELARTAGNEESLE